MRRIIAMLLSVALILILLPIHQVQAAAETGFALGIKQLFNEYGRVGQRVEFNKKKSSGEIYGAHFAMLMGWDDTYIYVFEANGGVNQISQRNQIRVNAQYSYTHLANNYYEMKLVANPSLNNYSANQITSLYTEIYEQLLKYKAYKTGSTSAPPYLTTTGASCQCAENYCSKCDMTNVMPELEAAAEKGIMSIGKAKGQRWTCYSCYALCWFTGVYIFGNDKTTAVKSVSKDNYQGSTTAPSYTGISHSSITTDNAVLSGTCLNPSRVTLKTGGCYISTMPGAIDNGQKLTDNIPSSYQTATSLPCSYNLKNEYGITLQSGTTYYYVFYVTDASGNSYYSQEYSFTTAKIPVTSVVVSPGSKALNIGNTTQLSATVSPTNASNRNVTWSSSNTAVATVSTSGLVTAKSVGSAVITATAADGSGKSGSATITVSCNHSSGYTILPAVSPTCTQTGLTEGKQCNACGTITVAQTTVPSTGHSHTATVTPPTCTAGGYTTYTCHCGDSYVADYTNEAGHSWSEWSVGMEPTATTEGQKFRTCGSCGETEFDTIPATGNTEPTTPSVVDSGTCGENLTWTLDSDGLLTISGTGEMDKSNGGLLYPQWYALRNSILSVVIEEGVTDIGDSAFYECENLSSITIPESVTKIGDYAFSSCYNLSSIALPENITSIGSNAFHFCESLTNIVLPESLISIGGTAFAACSGLSSITIPEGVIDIGDYAFYYCGNLTDIVLPESITRIGDYAFSGCKNLSTVHYAGTEAQRADISIGEENTDLTDATWHYECDGVVCMNPETSPTEPKPTEPKPTEPKPTEPKPTEPKPTTPPAEGDKPATNPFVDVPGDAFYHDPVLWAVDNAVTNGLDATHFGPDAGCTRAHVVTFLWRAAGEPAPSSSYNPFTDVLPGAYYYDAVLWAVEKGITNGVSATAFAPDQTCTRGQIVTFLWRYQHSPSASGTTSFIDIPAGQYYSTAVAWAVANSITNGMGEGIFAPDATCTRGQIVTFLYRAMA